MIEEENLNKLAEMDWERNHIAKVAQKLSLELVVLCPHVFFFNLLLYMCML